MNKNVETILKNSGWYIGRKCNISKYVDTLESDGYELNGTIKAFLEEFGGLKLYFLDPKVENHNDCICFDVKFASEGTFPETVRSYESRVNEKLVIIGYAYDGHMVVLMSHQGKVYAGYDETLVFLGDSGIDAIENVCLGKEPAPVP